jgi:predicted  nucleic acid-binding Zn-ribbon protein
MYGNIWSGKIPTQTCRACGHVHVYRDDAEWLRTRCEKCGGLNLKYAEIPLQHAPHAG